MKTLGKTFAIFFTVTFFMCDVLFAEVKSIGMPYVWNYKKPVYQAGQQSWMIDVSPGGLAYFANNDGLVEFDGKNWRTYPIISGSVLRSVKVGDDGRIFVGAFGEFGYFSANDAGKLEFFPLQQLVPEIHRNFGDVWKIFILPQGVIFQSYEQLMIYSGEKISVIPAPSKFHFSFFVNGEFYVNDQREGLLRLAGERLNKIPGIELLKRNLIWAILPKGDNLLISTADNGIFEYDGISLKAWKNEAEQLLMKNQVYCGMQISPSKYAFGTVQNGLLICDHEGRIFQQINLQSGLQNNTVLCMSLDQYDNLWLGLDIGIDYVEINSPLSYFSYSNGLSAGYAAILFQGNLYLGTNQGVFFQSWDELQAGTDAQFKIVPGTQGQVWKLEIIDGELLCGHNAGTFSIIDGVAEKISDEPGGWTFLKPKGHDDLLIQGAYSGLLVFGKENGKWRFRNQIKGMQESSRFLENGAKNEIWMSHGYKGVFKIQINEKFDSALQVDFYNSRHGFPSDFGINVFGFQNKPIFTTNQGIYVYDDKTNRFVFSKEINNLFGNRNPIVITQDDIGNIWYFIGNKTGVFKRQDDGSYFDLSLPFNQLEGEFVKGFQFVYPVNEQHVLFGTQQGFVHYLPQYPKNYQKSFNALVREIKISRADSVIFWGNPLSANALLSKIPFQYNGLQFSFSANDFENPEYLEFSTFLDGYDDTWTQWDKRNSREFTNLRNGSYTFNTKARNIYGVETEVAQISFYILPPWYLSVFAYLVYFLLFVLFIFGLSRYIKFRISLSHKREKERQQRLFLDREKQLQNEALLAEKELIKLRNEKLHAEMHQKDKELANATMQMIQKNKSLIKVRSDLQKLSDEIHDDLIQHQAQGLMKKINRDLDNEKQWQVFETHFENVHEEFLKRLKDKFPELSPRELKLCAYLKLNISSKEISTLMNISTRGVEISRYRLRKKLNLDRNSNLTDFIMGF